MPENHPNICVYCGAREGKNPAYGLAADGMGRMIAANGWGLVYGAGDVGLMGRVGRAAQLAGADTIGVIPVHLLKREVGKRDLSRFIVTETMHERKKVMFMNSNAVVVLPGGAGSLDEFFEVLTWRQIGLHEKPIFLLDIDGYWQPLMALLRHTVEQGFAEDSILDFVTAVPDLDSLEIAIRSALNVN